MKKGFKLSMLVYSLVGISGLILIWNMIKVIAVGWLITTATILVIVGAIAWGWRAITGKDLLRKF